MKEKVKLGGMYEERVSDLKEHHALIDFETPVYCYRGSAMVGSKLDMSVSSKQCRIAFEGELLQVLTSEQRAAFSIRRTKERIGKIEKVLDANTVLVKDLFKKETNMALFIGKKVQLKALGRSGTVDSTFGKSGKVKVVTDEPLPKESAESLINSEVAMLIEKEFFKSKKPSKK